MKVTMYELLGMIKDGKAPKKIKYDNIIFEYDSIYYMAEHTYLDEYCDLSRVLNDKVEIIEEKEMCHKCHKYPAEYNQTWCEFCLGISKEEKKIPEKLEDYYLDKKGECPIELTMYEQILRTKINDILDYLVYLKSKGDK